MINPQIKQIPVQMPIKGVNTVVNREGQPPDTCWAALNMLPYDRWGRKRVAQRPGLVNPFPGFNGAGGSVQSLTTANNIYYPSVRPVGPTGFNPNAPISLINRITTSTTTSTMTLSPVYTIIFPPTVNSIAISTPFNLSPSGSGGVTVYSGFGIQTASHGLKGIAVDSYNGNGTYTSTGGLNTFVINPTLSITGATGSNYSSSPAVSASAGTLFAVITLTGTTLVIQAANQFTTPSTSLSSLHTLVSDTVPTAGQISLQFFGYNTATGGGGSLG